MTTHVRKLTLSPQYLNKCLELNEKSPQYAQPECTKHNGISLFPHQKAALYRCKQLEKKDIQIRSPDMMNIKTNMGILADKPGAGKSHVVLSLIASDIQDQLESHQDHTHRGFQYALCNNKINVHMKRESFQKYIDTNFIVVSPTTVDQWKKYLQKVLPPQIPSFVASNKQEFDAFLTNMDRYKVAVLTWHTYKMYVSEMELLYMSEDFIARRVFYDDVDVMPVLPILKSFFYWYISSTTENIYHPFGNNSRYISGILNYTFVKQDLINLHRYCYGDNSSHTIDASPFIVRNDVHFVDRSMRFLPIEENYVESSQVLHHDHVKTYIQMGEINKAMHVFDITKHMTLVEIKKQMTQPHEACLLLKQEEEDEFLSDNHHIISEFVGQTRYQFECEKEDILRKIDAINKRIDTDDICQICFEPFHTRCILKCCQKSFCAKCLLQWLCVRNMCPLCKTNLFSSTDIFVEKNNETTSNTSSGTHTHSIHPENTKIVNLENILRYLRRKEDSKIIVGYPVPYHHSYLMPFIKTQMNIEYLKGNRNTVNKTLQNFKNRSDIALFMTKKYFGAGLNLECTTDIILFHKLSNDMEKQIIGRAQRTGRQTPLRVWYILHDTEMHEVHKSHSTPSIQALSASTENTHFSTPVNLVEHAMIFTGRSTDSGRRRIPVIDYNSDSTETSLLFGDDTD